MGDLSALCARHGWAFDPPRIVANLEDGYALHASLLLFDGQIYGTATGLYRGDELLHTFPTDMLSIDAQRIEEAMLRRIQTTQGIRRRFPREAQEYADALGCQLAGDGLVIRSTGRSPDLNVTLSPSWCSEAQEGCLRIVLQDSRVPSHRSHPIECVSPDYALQATLRFVEWIRQIYDSAHYLATRLDAFGPTLTIHEQTLALALRSGLTICVYFDSSRSVCNECVVLDGFEGEIADMDGLEVPELADRLHEFVRMYCRKRSCETGITGPSPGV